jgi:S-DNA-T family DNA segregation ATPase FtsK/SpoIIIE
VTGPAGPSPFASAPRPAAPTPGPSPAELTDEDAITEDDDMYQEALDLAKKIDKMSISLLQRRLRIGYTRAARLIELMKQRGLIDAEGNTL